MAQELQQQASERGGREGVRARLAVVVVRGGDGNEDAGGDVQEWPVQLRARVVGDLAGGVDVGGVDRPDVGEGGGDVGRLHRGERSGDGVLGHGWLLIVGPPR
ncbi:hypothetical protein [Streptomyces sp. NPDC055632]